MSLDEDYFGKVVCAINDRMINDFKFYELKSLEEELQSIEPKKECHLDRDRKVVLQRIGIVASNKRLRVKNMHGFSAYVQDMLNNRQAIDLNVLKNDYGVYGRRYQEASDVNFFLSGAGLYNASLAAEMENAANAKKNGELSKEIADLRGGIGSNYKPAFGRQNVDPLQILPSDALQNVDALGREALETLIGCFNILAIFEKFPKEITENPRYNSLRSYIVHLSPKVK
jgi:hypothetical protein